MNKLMIPLDATFEQASEIRVREFEAIERDSEIFNRLVVTRLNELDAALNAFEEANPGIGFSNRAPIAALRLKLRKEELRS